MSTEQEINFDVNDVNISDIMEQLHANIASRGYDIDELKRLSNGLTIKSPSVSTGGDEQLGNVATAVNSARNVQYWWVIPSQGGLKGKIRVISNKIMRKLTFFYMKHVVDQQNIFNSYTADSVIVLTNSCNNLIEENARLQQSIDDLKTENCELNKSIKRISDKIDETITSKVEKTIIEKMEKYVTDIKSIEDAYSHRQDKIDSINTSIAARLRRIENLNIRPSDTSMEASKELTITQNPMIIQDTDEKHDFDYFLFESKYRGSKEDIKKRQEHYLQYFRGQENVLDIGCGRGEFLELLGENNISAIGVDILPENIQSCKENNLNVVLGDAIEYLRKCEDESLGGIFCAQVIEHISTDQLIELVRLSNKKLKTGANLILETLNPQCLMIYAESFYLDPSHTKPVHPLAVKFIAECEGFYDNQIIFMTPSDYTLNIPTSENYDSESKKSISTINHLLFGNREYALVAKK